MFLSIIISCVRKELINIGLNVECELEIIKVEESCVLVRMETDKDVYLIRYYEKRGTNHLAGVLKELENIGIVTGLVATSDKIIVFKDLKRIGFYRSVTKEDLKNSEFIENLACLYRELHSVDYNYIDNYITDFSLKNVISLVKYYHLENNELFRYIIKNFDNLKLIGLKDAWLFLRCGLRILLFARIIVI